MKTKHTPGPWKTEYQQYEDGSHLCIAQENGDWIADMGTEKSTENAESKANAKLIATAPELLEALKTLSAQFEEVQSFFEAYVPLVDHNGKSLATEFTWDYYSEAMDKAKDAIQKATL